MTGEWVDVAPVASMPPGDYKVVDIDDVEIAVFNVGGEFYALEDVCTHRDLGRRDRVVSARRSGEAAAGER